ncbi:hypothetical protein SAMN04487768_1781 [Burkholderia sp. b13]|nr:hypothetical protein SAMN04487768_1781 [Burkholderia sp. b13]
MRRIVAPVPCRAVPCRAVPCQGWYVCTAADRVARLRHITSPHQTHHTAGLSLPWSVRQSPRPRIPRGVDFVILLSICLILDVALCESVSPNPCVASFYAAGCNQGL